MTEFESPWAPDTQMPARRRPLRLTEEDTREILLALCDARGVTDWIHGVMADWEAEFDRVAVDLAPRPGPERELLLRASAMARRRLREPSPELLYALTARANRRLADQETPIEELYLQARERSPAGGEPR